MQPTKRDDYMMLVVRPGKGGGGGYSGISMTGGGGVQRSLIFHIQENTSTIYYAPKKIQVEVAASDESYCVRKDTDDLAYDKLV